MKPESLIFLAIGVGLVWYVLEHQTTPQDVINSSTPGALIWAGLTAAVDPGAANQADLPPGDGFFDFDSD